MRGRAAVGVCELRPCGGIHIGDVEVEVAAVSVDTAMGRVLMNRAHAPCAEAARRQPRRILITSSIVVCVLGNPERMIWRDCAPILFLANATAHVHDTAHACKLIDSVEELLSAVGANSSVHLIIEDWNTRAEIAFAALIEVVRLLDWVFLVHEVVEAPALPHGDCLLDERIARRMDDACSLGRFANHEIVVDCGKVDAALVIGNVDALHRHRLSPLKALKEPKPTASSSSRVHVLIEFAPSSGSRIA